jgi:hypothetical protein
VVQDAKGLKKALNTWKRKLAEDIKLHVPTQENKKKRGNSNEDWGGGVPKERKLSGKQGHTNGLGLVKARKQPQ